MMGKTLLTIFIIITINIDVVAQSTLSAGSIAFTGYNSDNPEGFSFVLLEDIDSGTIIYFTDKGWTSAGAFRTSEGIITWTATTALTAGTQVLIEGGNGISNASISSSTGIDTVSGSFNLAATGDQILAYQGSPATPTFLSALTYNGSDWDADATSSNESAIPTGLTNGTNAVSVNHVDNASFGGCGGGTLSGTLASLGMNLNTGGSWSGDNDTNVTLPLACSFTVLCTDTSNPNLTCPSNATANTASGVCTAIVNGLALTNVSDDCTTNPIIIHRLSGATTSGDLVGDASGSTFNIGVTTITYTVSDDSEKTNTCTATVTVTDNENPTVSCPANVTVNTAAGTCNAVATWTVPTTSDNCMGATATPSIASGSTFDLGTNTVSYTATDASNNTAECTFTVTVNDNINPTITCPTDITTDVDAGACSAVVSFSATPADNCMGATAVASPVSGSAFDVGTTTVTYTATDASNNTSECTFTVTVNDNIPPSVTCPMDITKSLSPGQSTYVVNYTTPSGTDNCMITSASCIPISGSSFALGATTVNCTVIDGASLTGSCSFTVNIMATPATLDFSLEDPCSCTNPLNCTIGDVVYFHDTLTISTGGISGLNITVAAGAQHFYTAIPSTCPSPSGSATLVPAGTVIPEIPAGSGIYKLEYWRPSSELPELGVIESGNISTAPASTFQPICVEQDCLEPIPTMGEWGLICLSLMFMIIGVVAHNQESYLIILKE